MKKKFALVFFVYAIVFLSGCGTDHSGTYTGSETVQVAGSSPQSGQVTLKVSNGDNNTLNGTYSSSLGNGTFSGTISGDGNQLTNVSISMPQISSGLSVNGTAVGNCSGNFVGSLSLTNNSISGSLNLNNPAQTTTNIPSAVNPSQTIGSVTVSGACPNGSRSLTLNKQ